MVSSNHHVFGLKNSILLSKNSDSERERHIGRGEVRTVKGWVTFKEIDIPYIVFILKQIMSLRLKLSTPSLLRINMKSIYD